MVSCKGESSNGETASATISRTPTNDDYSQPIDNRSVNRYNVYGM